jgi:primosomal protein N' (replication factor Y)
LIFGEATYIDIILPLPIKQKFTYQLGDEHLSTAEIGCRVAVPFGRSKIYAGLIDAIHTNKPDYEVKFIIDVLDELPIASTKHFEFWQWIAEMVNV